MPNPGLKNSLKNTLNKSGHEHCPRDKLKSRLMPFTRQSTIDIQGVLLPDRQTLRGDSRPENKHY